MNWLAYYVKCAVLIHLAHFQAVDPVIWDVFVRRVAAVQSRSDTRRGAQLVYDQRTHVSHKGIFSLRDIQPLG